MSGQAIRFSSFPVSSIAQAGFYHARHRLSSHPSSPPQGITLRISHPRCHFSKRAVLGSSSDTHTVIVPLRRTPGETPSVAHIRAVIQRPASRQAARGERRDEGMACVSRSSPRPILSSVPRLAVPSRLASKQARQDGGRFSLSPPSSYSRLVSSSHHPVSPLVSAGRAKGVSFPSVPFSRPAGGVVRFLVPVAGARACPWLGPAAIRGKQAGKGGPSPVPSLVSSGGKSSPLPYRFSWPRHRHGGQASKTAAVLVQSARHGTLVSVPWLVPGPVG